MQTKTIYIYILYYIISFVIPCIISLYKYKYIYIIISIWPISPTTFGKACHQVAKSQREELQEAIPIRRDGIDGCRMVLGAAPQLCLLIYNMFIILYNYYNIL